MKKPRHEHGARGYEWPISQLWLAIRLRTIDRRFFVGTSDHLAPNWEEGCVRTLLIKLVDTFDTPCHGLAGEARQPHRGEVNGCLAPFAHVCVTLAKNDRFV